MIVDYFIVKKQSLDIVALYSDKHLYPSINYAGFIAFFVPVILTIIAVTFNTMTWFYNYGWFTGAFSGAVIYYIVSTFVLQPILSGAPEEA
ncbi:hypothetical protein P4S72_30020 [Vibrio sp. PP-XX7]